MTRFAPACLSLAVLTLAAAPHAHAGPLKPGLWEMRTIKQVLDGKDMTAQMAAATQQMREALAKMPADQRKQLEGKLAGIGAGEGGAHRICISPAMAAQDKPLTPKGAQCETAKTERNGGRTSYELNCQKNGSTMKGTGETVVEGDRVVSRMDMSVSGPKGTHRAQTETEMRFVGGDCGAIQPLDQLAREVPGARQ